MTISITRRLALTGIAAFTATGLAIAPIAAQDYPSGEIEYIVPYNPGGASDTIARLVAESIFEQTGQRPIVDYKPGAGGAIGANYVAAAEPDGYTIMAGTNSFFTTIPRLQPVQYDPETDLIPVAMTGEAVMPLAINPNLPVDTMEELVQYAREHPGELTFASSGQGTIGHLTYLYLQEREGIEMLHVPYSGGAEALNALASGQVDIGVDTGSAEFILDGQLKGLAILGPNRWSQLPDVPTIEEAGFPDWGIRSWHTVLVPGGTPDEVVQELNTLINTALESEELVDRLQAFGLNPAIMSVEEVQGRIARDQEVFLPILDQAGL
tara:strand:- start:33376 stop:34347 length:972 start_codon:yes stop_codon:yes gene_type:complete